MSNMIKVSVTDLRTNFKKYLQYVQTGNEIVILRYGKEVARLVSQDQNVSFITDTLVGVLKNDYNNENIKAERIKKH